MTLRERLADWISGGRLSALQAEADELWKDVWRRTVLSPFFAKREQWRNIATRHEAALSDIAAMETPGANATVRRMAQRAMEALK